MRRPRMALAFVFGAVGAVGAVAACGFDGVGSFGPGSVVPRGDASLDALREASTDGDIAPNEAASDAAPDAPPDSGLLFPFVYGHTDKTLYRLDPVTKTVALVAPLTGGANLADIAVARHGKMVGVGDDLYAIDPATGACTTLGPGPEPFNLTFVPAGDVDVGAETLVGYIGSDYYRVDRSTGVFTLITFQAITPYTPSGDLVSVEGGGTYVSVTGPVCADCLLEVNPKDGRLMKLLGSIGQPQIFGLGAWAGKLYGFAGNGETYELTIGAASVTSTLVTNPIKPGSWIGGGSSTRVPKQ
jgi:hypothetical protein